MGIRAYSKFRLLVTRVAHGSGYVAVNEFGLYEEADHSGVNLCIGATATSSGDYSPTTTPGKAVDGDVNTFWESAGGLTPKYLRFDLPSAKVVRCMYLSSTSYPTEVPLDFALQGSDDGLTWSDVSVFKDWSPAGTVKSAYEKTNVFVGGVSKLDTGARSSRVLLHNWVTGTHVATVFPGDDGVWSYQTRFSDDLLITHIGPVGFQPVSDGPVTPFVG